VAKIIQQKVTRFIEEVAKFIQQKVSRFIEEVAKFIQQKVTTESGWVCGTEGD
jgi:hypothetical protein